MTPLSLRLLHLVRDESGQDILEYALVGAFLGLASVASLQSLSSSLLTTLTKVGTTLTGAV